MWIRRPRLNLRRRRASVAAVEGVLSKALDGAKEAATKFSAGRLEGEREDMRA
jgi:hypothetical protein